MSLFGLRPKNEVSGLMVDGLSVEIARRSRRRMSLTIYPPDGRVRVGGPMGMGDGAVRDFVRLRRAWIDRHRARIRARAAAMPPAPEFVTGEKLFYRGRAYHLEVIEYIRRSPAASGSRSAHRVVLEDDSLRLFVPAGTGKAERKKALDLWYRERLVELIPPVLARWETVVGVEVMAWGVKRMKTKWGTCNPRARRIWLSLELAKKPAHCLDYIMVHELTHILEPSHNARFKGLMDRFMPEWREHRKELLSWH